jgi:hypothetical protein
MNKPKRPSYPPPAHLLAKSSFVPPPPKHAPPAHLLAKSSFVPPQPAHPPPAHLLKKPKRPDSAPTRLHTLSKNELVKMLININNITKTK